MAKKKAVVREQIHKILNGSGDEYIRLARYGVDDYLESGGEPELALSDFEMNVGDACESWGMAEDGTEEKRVALLRLASAVVVCLAVDEVVRGVRACERIEQRLRDDGVLKPARPRR